jgi:hypothetical protein
MNYQHIENMLVRFRNQLIVIKTVSGGSYEGTVTDVTNDYVTLRTEKELDKGGAITVLLHAIESVSAQTN